MEAIRLAETNRQRVKQEEESKFEAARQEQKHYWAAISDVVLERQTVRKKCTRAKGDPSRPGAQVKSLASTEYLAALTAIHTSDCPKQFQLAWLEYVQTWEREVSYPVLRRVEDVAETVGAIKDVSLLRDVDERAEKRDMFEAWRHCKRVALEFDVEIADDPPL
jgi:hypothetical protein